MLRAIEDVKMTKSEGERHRGTGHTARHGGVRGAGRAGKDGAVSHEGHEAGDRELVPERRLVCQRGGWGGFDGDEITRKMLGKEPRAAGGLDRTQPRQGMSASQWNQMPSKILPGA